MASRQHSKVNSISPAASDCDEASSTRKGGYAFHRANTAKEVLLRRSWKFVISSADLCVKDSLESFPKSRIGP